MPKILQSNNPVTYIGIDPGKAGGISLLNHDGITAHTMPLTELDLWSFISRIVLPAKAIIEHVNAMPRMEGKVAHGMGATSAFTFGMGYGNLRMALIAADIPFEPIRPQVWQKALNIPPRKSTEDKPQFKDRLRAKAQQLFPQLELWQRPKSKGLQLAVCDSILIAVYCQRRFSS